MDPGDNIVYLAQRAFGGNLGATLLHEALHLSYENPDTHGFVGFGLRDIELAQAVGVYKEGMTNDQASAAFSKAMDDKCH